MVKTGTLHGAAIKVPVPVIQCRDPALRLALVSISPPLIMKLLPVIIATVGSTALSHAVPPPQTPPPADGLKSVTTHAAAYGATKNAVNVDPAKDLPRYPAVEPKDAVATWQVKKGFRLELAAHEPQVRDPIAVCFDERGRMFVCEMIDYSEMRDVTPHLGRISMLEDKDGDGHFETASVFADNLPWPTGLTWANGGLYVGATPDIWRFEDKDGDGKAEVREKVFTGFGTGLKILNVQGLMNSFQWGLDNRVHVLAGGGNRGVVTCLKRPDLPGIELGGRDFWFDPLTHEFGLEGGGAQYGMSFDNYGRKFGCSNSDHLQYWLYDSRYAARNPHASMPVPRKSIAVDGGAAEVFRLSPDEPWRIIRTRWRIAGVVKGAVEGGGRVSGYFTGATGTTIYRGDAYGPEFLNNSFTGDAGGQLIHRKVIRPTANGVDLEGERPQDERGFEFAASNDTWVRVVNFANAPDGHLYVCDMYREIIEHPWAVPDEIKKHLDLNSGNDRGRIWRIVKTDGAPPQAETKGSKSYRTRTSLDKATTEDLVQTLAHSNGWHRDTAARLLYERQDKAAVPVLVQRLREFKEPLATIHRLHALEGLQSLTPEAVILALDNPDEHVREHAILAAEKLLSAGSANDALWTRLASLVNDPSPRVRFQLGLTLGEGLHEGAVKALASLPTDNEWALQALFSARPELASALFKIKSEAVTSDANKGTDEVLAGLAGIIAARYEPSEVAAVMQQLGQQTRPSANVIRALAAGLKKAGTSLEKVDQEQRLKPVFASALKTAADSAATEASRLSALELVALADAQEALPVLKGCLDAAQTEAVQNTALKGLVTLRGKEVTGSLLASLPALKPKVREAALVALVSNDERAAALLKSMESPESSVKPADLTASQVQALATHKNASLSAQAKKVLASVIPPSREEVVKKFAPAVTMKGDAVAGNTVFMSRCLACHVGNGVGIEVGPPLTTVKTRGRDGLLSAILEPHKEVASQYIAYTVNTKDGQTLSGIIAKDDASSMTLKMMGGAQITIQRSNIQGSSSTGQSLMPEGLEQGMSVDDMANLLSFIEAVK